MKYLINPPFKISTSFFCATLLLLVLVSSCDPTKRINNNNNNPTHLDPVTTDHTDTSRTGTYNPVTDVGNTTTESDTLTWCDTLQQTEFRKIVVCFEKIGNGPIKADTVDVIEINNDAIYAGTIVDTTIQRKLAYKVVIMMPFMSHGFVPTPIKEIPPRSIKSVEFYEGVLIALDSLKAEGVSLFVNVVDSQRDTAIVKALLETRELQEADLIVGPLTSRTLKLVAEFAKENQKPLISPFNSRSNLTKDNPYYIQINPSFDVHSDYIIEHLHKIERDKQVIRTPMEKHIIILGMQQDSSRIEALQKSYASYKNDTSAKILEVIKKTAFIDVEDIKPKLMRDKLNIIVMPHYQNEGFVYNSLREIQKLVDKVEPKKGYQLAIVGMDHWKYYNRVNFEYFESMNLHLSSQFFTDRETSKIQKFRSDYKAVYGIGTREFGFIGYDIMLYFGRMIHKYGINFQTHLWKEPTQFHHTKFQIEPSYEIMVPLDASPNEVGKTIMRSYENKYLNFLKFEDYKLQKVN